MRGCSIVRGMVGIVLWGLSIGWAQSGQTTGLVLLTPKEAEQLRLTADEWLQPVQPERSRGVSLGPRIMVQSPQLQATSQGPVLDTVTPMDLIVVFEERGAAVDMQSLRVQARKGLFTKSLTELLRPYILGTRVEAKGVQVPEGRFAIQIEIADMQEVKTVETYRLEVKKR